MRQRLADYRGFWRQFREAYYSTGAVLPSGRGLGRALGRFCREDAASQRAPLRAGANGAADEVADEPSAGPSLQGRGSLGRRILEVGPGTGAVTVQIIGDMRAGDRLVLEERNAEFVEHLKRRFVELSPG